MSKRVLDELIRALPTSGSGAAHSRRSFLAQALAGGTAMAALGIFRPSLRAQAATNDLDFLLVALTLERMGVAFYEEHLPEFNTRAFRRFNRFNSALASLRRQGGGKGTGPVFPPAAPGDLSGAAGSGAGVDKSPNGDLLPTPGTGFASPSAGTIGTGKSGDNNDGTGGAVDVRSLLQRIRANENAHLALVEGAVRDRTTVPPAPTFNFGVNGLDEVLRLAREIENVDAMFYRGAASVLQDRALLEQAAAISSVEARQAAYLNLLHGDVPFPTALEPSTTPGQAAAYADQFVTGADSSGDNSGNTGTGTLDPGTNGNTTTNTPSGTGTGRRRRRR